MPDPISVIATIVSAATGSVGNSTLPLDVKISAQNSITSGGDIAKSLDAQLNSSVSQLPEPARRTARDSIERATEQIARLVPPGPLTPQAT
ncbi:hypothetical protein, partial [Nocardia alni]|uniref:hypothetical protein n=1 Tax=Nocardia alni TaxID=2815723 RepID=UPI001C24F0E9